MKYRTILIATGIFLFNACSSDGVEVKKAGSYYHGIYFGKNLNDSQKKGLVDGCKTALGTYTKSHQLFNEDSSYNEGWFLGRSKCIEK